MAATSILRSTFLLMASTIAVANAVPGFQSRFVVYGARSSSSTVVPETSQDRVHKGKTKLREASSGPLKPLLDIASNMRVPHAWFYQFYLLSFSLSVFWAFQIATRGQVYSFIAVNASSRDDVSMTITQTLLAWAMMTAQGMRRLYESLEYSSTSNSKMWIAHWAAGLVFYASMSVAIWVEGIPAITSNKLSFEHLIVLAPSLKSFIAIPLFLTASGIQYDCHGYLASLKKYSLPIHPMFQLLICPHYFAECVIYLSLALVAAPPGMLLNGTVSCALVFVIVNLGITARNTREWYAARFGEDKITDRWNMIPYVW